MRSRLQIIIIISYGWAWRADARFLVCCCWWCCAAACLPHWSDDVWAAAAVVVARRSTRYLQGVARPCGSSVAGWYSPAESHGFYEVWYLWHYPDNVGWWMGSRILGHVSADKVHGFMIMGWGWGCKVETRTDSIGALAVEHALNGAEGF